MKTRLTQDLLKTEAQRFAEQESIHYEPSLFGVTEGKAVGTYFEHKFQAYLRTRYDYLKVVPQKVSISLISNLI